jgi:FkbM family methyltransferase
MKFFPEQVFICFASSVILGCGARFRHSTKNPAHSISEGASLKTAKAVEQKWKVKSPDFAVPTFDIDALSPKTNLTNIVEAFTKVQVHYVKTPTTQHLNDMHSNTSGMYLGHLPVPGKPSTEVDIYCYSADEDQYVSGSILEYGAWECDFVADCASPWLANPDLKGNFLDLGGNIGAYTLPLGRFLQGKGEVISVEGMPDIADHLKAGIVANSLSNVNLFEYCVGAPDATDYLTMNRNPFNKGGSTIDGNKNSTGTPQGRNVTVGLTTLDAMLESLPALKSVVVMKSDIEGNEGRMLRGGYTFFTKYPPCYLQFELHPDWLKSAGTPYTEVLQVLTDFGYKMAHHMGGYDYQFEQNDMASCLKRFA